MPDDVVNQPTITPAAATPSPGVSPAAPSVPQDYEELKKFREDYEPTIAAIAPYIDDIRPIVENERTREFLRKARTTYEKELESQAPQLSPELSMVRDEFRRELDPIVGYIKDERKAKEYAAAKAKEEAGQANLAYANRLVAERPDLAEDDYAGIQMLASYAAPRGISLEEAWKRKGTSLGAPAPKVAPPRSLRGDAAAPGVPGESKEPPIKSARDLTRRLAANLRAGGMKG
jgi:hypothetical protein